MIGVPKDWPPGHHWSGDWDQVTCVDCHHSRLEEFVGRGQTAQAAVDEIINKAVASWPATAYRLPEEMERVKQARELADGVLKNLGRLIVPEERLMYTFLIAAAKLQPGLGDLDNNVSDRAMRNLHRVLDLVLQTEVYARATGGADVSATNSLNLGGDNRFTVTGTASVPAKKNGS